MAKTFSQLSSGGPRAINDLDFDEKAARHMRSKLETRGGEQEEEEATQATSPAERKADKGGKSIHHLAVKVKEDRQSGEALKRRKWLFPPRSLYARGYTFTF